MTLSPEQRGGLVQRFKRLTAAVRTADEDLLVAVYEATQQGASHRDLAHLIGLRPSSKSGIPDRAAKGKAILERRRRT